MEILQDGYIGPSSPSKGKGIDTGSKTWRAGWWDLYPLIERPKRPLQWSQSSVIFTAHPTRPLVAARHFSSSKQFVLPSPTQIIASPGSYDPPTVLTVSPGDTWLFSYFPRRDGEGIGCLWKRGPQIDNWVLNECWTYPQCGGVVAASWLGNHREWTINAQGDPTRLPPRGPTTPVADPTLLIVTEDHWLHLAYIRFYNSGVRFIKRYLPFNGGTSEVTNVMDLGDNPNNTRRCLDAAIGIGYNETSVVIALHSSRLPPPIRQANPIHSFNSMNLSVPVDLTNANAPDQKVVEWDIWGEERTIELFEVAFRFEPNIALVSTMLGSVECQTPLTSLTFACAPPQSQNTQATPDNHSPPKRNITERGKMFLLTSFIDFHGYSKPPTSTLASHVFVYRPNPNNPRGGYWSFQKESTRILEAGVITYIQPVVDTTSSNAVLLYTCILDTSGLIPTGQKQAAIGTTKVLNIPDLADASNWETGVIRCSIDSIGRDLPLSSTISPNGKLLCTLSSSLTSPQTAVHALPKKHVSNTSSSPLSLGLAVAILGRVSTADLVHTISSRHTSLDEAINVIYNTLDLLDSHYKSELPYPSTWDVVGVATEVYRAQSLHAKDEKESTILKDLWQTAHDICSLAACNIAFEDCKEEEGYDLDAVWQIISICTWVVSFTERLMKACVLSNNSLIATTKGGGQEFETVMSPILLHLAHPFALQNFISALRHVQTFRTFLGSLPAGGKHAKMAQAVLIDAVDCSGVDFGGLISLLDENLATAQKQEPKDCRMALAGCRPTPGMQPRLGELLEKIAKSETILNKAILFIKPSDLVDGMARISIINQPKKDERDIITKGILDNHGSRGLCLRCGGKTSLEIKESFASNHSYPKWTVWELMWQLRCICGGSWLSVT
ncbi:hypothetical protein BDN70DRAFT_872266 [Pholiota conissans]|uniref:Mediator complex subunit 16 n=1 Tax=Pholiota conissans TaxID=109636 RepID=A0A9P5ZDL9_9AGAR|nr:hypothetical protein BDN70DRAFT_872266 [Pholiota conissans]